MSVSPRSLEAGFLAVTLLFAGALACLGWRSLEQDRVLLRQRRLDLLDAAAERVTAALYHRLSELEETLEHPSIQLTPGTVLIRARHGEVDVTPADGLLFHPVTPRLPEVPAETFSAGESLEFGRNDPAAAVEVFRTLTRSARREVRAGALVRLGRTLRKAGRTEEALRVYQHLALMDGIWAEGLPAQLVALEARCSVYEQLGRRAELEREARALFDQLASGRWRLSRSTLEFQIAQARAWLGAAVDYERNDKYILSTAVEEIWLGWLREPGSRGRRIIQLDAYPVLASWQSNNDELRALVAPAQIVKSAAWEEGEYIVTLADANGQVVLGRTNPLATMRVERTPASTKLPWTVQVATLSDGTAELAGRRRILIGGLALLLLLLVTVSYTVARAATKEVAVARLQADFVAAVSHEFRSPLSSICQMSELLSEDRWPSDNHRRRCHEILNRESSRLRRLVEGLLDFARMESGTAVYRLEPVEPKELVFSIVEQFREQPAARSVEVRFTAEEEVPCVNADSEALGRAIWNLLDNAVKYSPDSRKIAAEVGCQNGYVAIRIQDEGIGIPTAEQKEIFRKFVRGSEAKTRGLKGTGIGLAMVSHIVEGHGGDIRLESEPGRGSTFTILLPIKRRS